MALSARPAGCFPHFETGKFTCHAVHLPDRVRVRGASCAATARGPSRQMHIPLGCLRPTCRANSPSCTESALRVPRTNGRVERTCRSTGCAWTAWSRRAWTCSCCADSTLRRASRRARSTRWRCSWVRLPPQARPAERMLPNLSRGRGVRVADRRVRAQASASQSRRRTGARVCVCLLPPRSSSQWLASRYPHAITRAHVVTYPTRRRWFGCGGRMVPGETPERTARRLLDRELGVRLLTAEEGGLGADDEVPTHSQPTPLATR
jgi:hypothetical protein